MQSFEEIKQYCDCVCEQVRWKKVKPVIAAEIENHLCDQRDAYMARGDNEASATKKSVLQMGDAVLVGQQLDKTHKPKPQWNMLVLTGILMLIGFAINFYLGRTINPIGNNLIAYSLLFFAPALIVLICCYFLDFSALGRYPLQCYCAVIIVSLICTIPYIMGGWLAMQFSIVLSHLSLVFPLAFALFVYAMRNKGLRGVLFCGMGYLPFAVLLWMLTTISGLFFYTIAALVILCFAIARGWFGVKKMQALLLVLLPALFAFCFLLLLLDNRHRLEAFINPYEDRFGAGYAYYLIREFLANAVWFGKGAVPSIAKDIMAVPYIHSEYVLVYFIHQFGYVVLLGVLLVLTAFSVLGMRKILKQKSVLGSLVAFAVLATFMLQSVFYVVSNLGYGFISAFPLPFISYGRSALLIDSALIGFMLSVFRTEEIFKDASNTAVADKCKNRFSLLSYENGKLMIDLRLFHDFATAPQNALRFAFAMQTCNRHTAAQGGRCPPPRLWAGAFAERESVRKYKE